jgi:hypothetical protein
MTERRTGTREEWLAARRELLDAEKEHMRQLGQGLLPAVRLEDVLLLERHPGQRLAPAGELVALRWTWASPGSYRMLSSRSAAVS